MILSFSCKNFYSFADKTTVSFIVDNNTPQNDSYFSTQSGIRLSKITTVIGPNASGKTSLLRVLPFLKWLITDSYSQKPDTLIPVKPFLFGESKNNPTELSVEFEIGKDIFIYSFILDDKRILEETLQVKNKTQKRTTKKMLFTRQWNAQENKYKFSGENFDISKEFENLFNRTNSSVISAAIRLPHKRSETIGTFWKNVSANVAESGYTGNHHPRKIELFYTFDFFHDNEKLKKEAEKLLARFDLGFDYLDIKKEKTENGITLNIQTRHRFNNQNYHLSFQEESSGTQQLIILLKTVLQVLDRGGIAVLDEFDTNLHPDMIFPVIELFHSPQTNPKNAQILFSTHSHRILQELDKYQIILVEKNKQGQSEAWRLDEMSGVARADDNYYTKYIAGAYGALPKIG